jgi:hypothetical protein
MSIEIQFQTVKVTLLQLEGTTIRMPGQSQRRDQLGKPLCRRFSHSQADVEVSVGNEEV